MPENRERNPENPPECGEPYADCEDCPYWKDGECHKEVGGDDGSDEIYKEPKYIRIQQGSMT